MSAVKTTPLGRNGPSVTAVGIGLMSLGNAYGHAGSDAERLAYLDSIYAMGERFWDNADIYGDSEELTGKWFAANPEKRKDVFLATKFALVITDITKGVGVRSDPEYVKEAVERSLKKLQTDYIDLYYCHRVDGKTPIEKTVEAMAELKQQGKIKYLGLSEVTPNTLRRAHAVHPIAAVQIEYNPWSVEPETTGLIDTCAELGVALVAYSPLGRGFLTGQIKTPEDVAGDSRSHFPRFYPENFYKNLEIVTKLEAIAEKKGVKPGQMGMAWLIRQGQDKGCSVIPIPGTRNAERQRENLGALDVELTEKEDKEIRDVVEAAKGEDFGGRYPDMMSHMQDGETPELEE